MHGSNVRSLLLDMHAAAYLSIKCTILAVVAKVANNASNYNIKILSFQLHMLMCDVTT